MPQNAYRSSCWVRVAQDKDRAPGHNRVTMLKQLASKERKTELMLWSAVAQAKTWCPVRWSAGQTCSFACQTPKACRSMILARQQHECPRQAPRKLLSQHAVDIYLRQNGLNATRRRPTQFELATHAKRDETRDSGYSKAFKHQQSHCRYYSGSSSLLRSSNIYVNRRQQSRIDTCIGMVELRHDYFSLTLYFLLKTNIFKERRMSQIAWSLELHRESPSVTVDVIRSHG